MLRKLLLTELIEVLKMSNCDYYFSTEYSGDRDGAGYSKIHIHLMRYVPKSFLGMQFKLNPKILATKWNVVRDKDEIQKAIDSLKSNISLYESSYQDSLAQLQREEEKKIKFIEEAKERKKYADRMILDIHGKKIEK